MRVNVFNILPRLIAILVTIVISAAPASAQAPVAAFSGTPVSGCSPLIVAFQDLSTGNPTTWSWNFGNGNTSSIRNPTASYFTPGTYTVTLTATNASGTNTLTKTNYITVYEPPTVNFIADVAGGCFPLRVQFTDLSIAGVGNTNTSWQWDFGNGNTSTLQNPIALYTTAGTFTVTLRVTNDKGCTKTVSRPAYINVTPGVRSVFTNSQAVVCNPPADIAFTNTSTGPPTLSYLWDFGDGNFSIAPNPVHTYTGSGTFIATLITFSTAGCQDTARSNPIVIGGFNNSFTAPLSACINEVVTFTNTSVPVPGSANWTFGDGGIASGINATHTYTVPGTYNVWLYNTFANCRDSVMKPITINPRPVADFTAPITASCQPPLTVNFQDLSTGGAVSWQWNFGDGGSSTLQNPSYTYNTYGSFTVRLITTNGFGCTDTVVRNNYIRIQRASISITGLPVRGCIPYTITPIPVIISVDAITSYEWDFGDGGTSTAPAPVYTYLTQGTYSVRLIITTSTGCRDTLIVNNAVRVGSKPIADFSAVPIPVCGRQPVYFTDLSVPADEWLWDFGDGGTSTIKNPSYSYNDTGYFTVRLIATNNGCPDTITKINYTHILPPIARFSSAANCVNRLQFFFTDQSAAPQTWAWNFGDGSPIDITQNPVHNFPAFGTYTVRLIVTNGSCADSISQIIRTIDENPDFSADRLVACKNAVINFMAGNILTSNVVNYYWDYGDGNVQNTSSPTSSNNYTVSGNYTVLLVTTDLNGCRDSVRKTNYIRINGPLAGFSATNVAGCTNLTTTFTDLSVPDGVNAIVNWRWDYGDGTIQNYTAPPFQHLYISAGTFSVKLIITDAAGCRDSIILSNIVTTTDPVPNFNSPNRLTCPGATVSFINTSTPASVTSSWDFGDGGTSLSTSPTHFYTTPGLYTVKLRIQDPIGCADSITRNMYIRVDTPHADFSIIDSISSCLPFEIIFTNTSTFYTSSFWDFGPGQGTSTLTSPIHYYSVPGIYPVKLIVTSPGGCLDSMIKTVQVYDTVGSRVDYIPLSGCSPLPIFLTASTSGPMNSYFWDFGDGYTAITTTPSVSHIYATYGNYLPKVIMEDPSGCLIPLQGLDTVLITGAKAKFGVDNKIFCDFGTVNFIDSTTFNNPVTAYYWSFGDGGISSAQNPVHSYLAPGNYSVQLIIETQLGCRDTLTKPNYIKVVQRPLIDIGGDTVVCANSFLLHRGLFIQPDTSVVRWSWNFPNGNISLQQNPTSQTYITAGTFVVTAVATNSTGCKDTTSQTIYVNPLPTVTMPGQLTVQTGFPVTIPATYSPNTLSWIWSPAAGLSCTNCPNPDAGPKFDTFYQVYFTDDKGCSNTGSLQVIVICKNANLFIPNTFTPNGDGSNEVFYPRGKGLERVKLLRIFNRWGEVVFEKRDFPINDASTGWDGTFKGKKPVADVYVYQAEVFCENGDIIRLNGNIALIL
ncbi:MAG: PKD domain-containing protein [Bacteroidota bacterium]|nr:PKD domain-containing protein [Bacteroidota bacterium]